LKKNVPESQMAIKKLSRMVRSKRENLGWSQRKLSEVTGIPFSTLSRIENAKGVPDSDNLETLCSWLEVRSAIFFPSQPRSVVVVQPCRPTPELIEELLLKDKHLTEAAALALSSIFKTAYSHLRA